jgi:hypothetical protein
MTIPRRRLIRPATSVVLAPQRHRRLQKLRERLEHERTALARWQKRLSRAFNTVLKHQKRVARIERQLSQLEE